MADQLGPSSEKTWGNGKPPDTVSGYVKELAISRDKKRLFVCCDGTWKNASGTIAPLTNVAKLARCVDRIGNDELGPTYELRDGSKPKRRFGLVRQLVYYSSGVGTQSSLAMDSGFSGATGHGVTANILSAYCFICNNYNFSSTMDDIILVGFSRGAFTVLCLAAFIDKVGLLRRKGLPFLRLLFDHWLRQETDQLDKMVKALNPLLYDKAIIKVLAEWDPVSAMGLPFGFRTRKLSFIDDKVPHAVDNAFVALALDEKRPSFKPLLWTGKSKRSTTVKQCGFIGSHSDIRGGNADSGLSTVSLLWMISQISSKCHAQFDSTALLQFLTPLQSSLLKHERAVGPGKIRKLYLKNLSSTEGHVNESLAGLWLVPKYLSLGLLRGKRHALLDQLAQKEGGPKSCHLTVHFTVRLIAQNEKHRVRCGFFKRYKLDKQKTLTRWVRQRPGTSSQTPCATLSFPEESLDRIEKRLLEEWLKQAEYWWRYDQDKTKNADGKSHGEPDIDGIYWSNVIKMLGLDYVSGCSKDESLISLIQPELDLRREPAEEQMPPRTQSLSGTRSSRRGRSSQRAKSLPRTQSL